MQTATNARPVHERLKEKREKAGVSRAALAARLGASYTTIWRWEIGDTNPPPASLFAWKAAVEELVQKARRKK